MSSIENIQNTQFTGNTQKNTVEAKVENKKEKPKFNNKKIIGALVGLGIAAAAGIAIASKIRKGKTVDTEIIDTKICPSINTAVADITDTKISPNNFDNIDIDEFKKIGNFKKGETFIGDNPYTGTISVKNKKGIFALEYENGKLVNSTKYSNDFPQPIVSKKIYSTSEDGTRTIQKFNIDINGEEKFASKTKITQDEVKTTTIKDGIELSHGAFKKEIKYKDKTIKNIWQPYKEEKTEIPIYNTSDSNKVRLQLNLKRKYNKITTVDPRKPGVEIAKPRYAKNHTEYKSEPLIRKTENGVTYKNGNKFATRTQTIDNKGNKIITVNYGDSLDKKVITITPEGERIVSYID